MDKKNITPEQNQPINRITSGQLPAELAELSEEILQIQRFPLLRAQYKNVLMMVTTRSRQLILPRILNVLKHRFLPATVPDLPR